MTARNPSSVRRWQSAPALLEAAAAAADATAPYPWLRALIEELGVHPKVPGFVDLEMEQRREHDRLYQRERRARLRAVS